MLVDGHVVQSGARLVSTLHSSTVVDGSFDIGGSEFMNVDINMPRDKIEIMNFTYVQSLVLLYQPLNQDGVVGWSFEASLEGITMCIS